MNISKVSPNVNISKATALKFVVLIGVVSLFADMTYEGGRSIAGPYLAVLGASGTAVGIVAGLGELIGYGLRLISGYFSDRTGRYWAITIFGYTVNMLAVPLLALEVSVSELKTEGLPRVFWLYLVAVGLIAAGFADFSLIAYHFQQAATVSPTWIPLLYAVAMGIDALAALVCGRLFDRLSLTTLLATALPGRCWDGPVGHRHGRARVDHAGSRGRDGFAGQTGHGLRDF